MEDQQPKLCKEALRGAIKFDCMYSTLSMRQIANKYQVNLSTVQTWKKRDFVTDKKKIRKPKAQRKHIDFIKNLGDGKYTGIQQASARQIAYKLNEHFNRGLKKLQFSLSYSTVNKILNRELSKPRKTRTTFKLRTKDKVSRVSLIQYLKDNNLGGENIFFTDECRFLLDTPLNPQTNQIRFNKEDLKKLKAGNNDFYEKLAIPQPKYTTGFMVAGGMSANGLGKLIFCIGTMNTKCYGKALEYYKEDIQRLNADLNFQQDGASCHTSKKSEAKIGEIMSNKLPFWPANSPDLSPIEVIWALIKEKLQERKHKNLEELKSHLVFLWNRVPKGLCRKLINQFDKKIRLIKDSGERINRLPNKKYQRIKRRLRWEKKWNVDNEDDAIERIVFNDKKLVINKKRAVLAIKKEIIALKKEKKKVNKDVLTDKQLKSKYQDDKVKTQREIEKKKDNKAMWAKKIQMFKDKIDELEAMSLDEWYDSLRNELKMKLIRFHPLKTADLISMYSGETEATINEVYNDDDNSEHSEKSSSIIEEGDDMNEVNNI